MPASWNGIRIFVMCLISVWDTGSDLLVVVVWLAGLDGTGRHYWWGGILLTCIVIPTIINFFIVMRLIGTLPSWTLLFALFGLAPLSLAIGMLYDGKILLQEEPFYLTKLIELFMEAISSGVLQLWVLFHYSGRDLELGKNTQASDIIVWLSVLGSICSIGGGSVVHKKLNKKNVLRGLHIALNFVARTIGLIMIPIIISNWIFGLCLVGGMLYLFEFGIVICTIMDNDNFNCGEKFFTASLIAIGNVPTITSFCFRWADDYWYEVELHVRFLSEVALLVSEIHNGTAGDLPWGITGLACSVLGMVLHYIENWLKRSERKSEVFSGL